MHSARVKAIATFLVVATGSLWGLYWWPVRALDAFGLSGAWGTFAMAAVAAGFLFPLVLINRGGLRSADPRALFFAGLGGVAILLYSIAVLHGDVAVIVILFFLTPVWSTLIARVVFGQAITGLRVAALVCGVSGLVVMLGGDGQVPVPRGLGEWLGLLAGIVWAIATAGISATPRAGLPQSAFCFAAGAAIAGLAIALVFAPLPSLVAGAGLVSFGGLVLFSGLFWWGGCVLAIMWAAPRLEPARVGILLMAEVLVGAVSAAVLAGEPLGPPHVLGGAFVLAAGVFEVWPVRQAPRK